MSTKIETTGYASSKEGDLRARFKELNDLGEARRSEVERALLKLCEALDLPSELASPKTQAALP